MNRLKQIVIVLAIIFIGLLFLRKQITHNISVTEDSNAELLNSFEEKKVWDISPEKGFDIKLSRKHVTHGKYSLEVKYPQWNLPSINTKKIKQDWGHYDFFTFDVYNPQKDLVDFHIRLDDTDRKKIDIPYRLEPGLNQVSISREQIAAKINYKKIRFVVLYIYEPRERYTLYFDNMRLQRSGLIEGAEDTKLADFLPDKGSIQDKKVRQIEEDPLPVRKAVELPSKEYPGQGEIKVVAAKFKEAKDNLVFVSAGIPFAPGQLTHDRKFYFLGKDGKEIPIAAEVLARWPQDGSIRSVLVQFHYPITHLYEKITLKWGAKRKAKDLKVIVPTWSFPQGYIVMPAQWLCDSQVVGEHVPFGRSASGGYDNNTIEKLIEVNNRTPVGSLRHDGYYSTPHVNYQIYVRTGEPKYFLSARKELLNYRDRETRLEGEFRGASYLATDVGRYTYVQALVDDYLLTGDPRSLEVAGYMAEFLKNNFSPEKAYYKKDDTRFFTERYFAFPFLGVISYYELTQDKAYLEVADRYMDNLYKTQLEWPSRGGFIHNLHAHDPEEGARKDEYGGSPFMTGLLLEAIIKYHKITKSDKAADSIFRAVDWLIAEGLSKSGDTFKYLTADKFLNSEGTPDLNMLIVHAFGYAYKLSGYKEEKYLEIGQKVFERGVKDAYLGRRKHFNQNYRSSGHYLAYIEEGLKIRALQPRKIVQNEIRKGPVKNVIYYEDFEKSNGRFIASGDTFLKVDDQTTYLNGNSLRIKNRGDFSNFASGFEIEHWNIDEHPYVSFAYLIPPRTPVGLRLYSQHGDWIYIGGTETAVTNNAKVKDPLFFTDDGQWHEIVIDVNTFIKSLLPGVEKIGQMQFYTHGNGKKDQQFWIDDFKIRR